jgi:hypothetical protein
MKAIEKVNHDNIDIQAREQLALLTVCAAATGSKHEM